MSIAEIVAVLSGGIILLAGIICLVAYMVKYAKQYGTLNMLIHIGWIIVGISSIALYISLWFINAQLVAGISVVVLLAIVAVIGIYQSDN